MELRCMLILLFRCVSVCKFVLYIPLHIDVNPVGRRGVWFRALYDVPRTRNTFHAAGNPLYKGNLCYYADRALFSCI